MVNCVCGFVTNFAEQNFCQTPVHVVFCRPAARAATIPAPLRGCQTTVPMGLENVPLHVLYYYYYYYYYYYQHFAPMGLKLNAKSLS